MSKPVNFSYSNTLTSTQQRIPKKGTNADGTLYQGYKGETNNV